MTTENPLSAKDILTGQLLTKSGELPKLTTVVASAREKCVNQILSKARRVAKQRSLSMKFRDAHAARPRVQRLSCVTHKLAAPFFSLFFTALCEST